MPSQLTTALDRLRAVLLIGCAELDPVLDPTSVHTATTPHHSVYI